VLQILEHVIVSVFRTSFVNEHYISPILWKHAINIHLTMSSAFLLL